MSQINHNVLWTKNALLGLILKWKISVKDINMVILIVVLQFNLLPKFHFSKISIKRDKCDINCKKTYRRHLEIDEKLSKNSDQLRAQPKSKLCLLPVAGLRITKYQSRYFYHYQILQDKKHFLHYIIYITFYFKKKCNSDIIWNWMINVPDFFS